MPFITIYTTTGTREEAQRIAKSLVERELVACAQISEIESFYSWEGTIQNEQEFSLVLKTTEERYSAVEAAIRSQHSYTLPAIYALSSTHVYPPFARWVEECTGAVQAPGG